jgi:iron complex outermembrane receptor protein
MKNHAIFAFCGVSLMAMAASAGAQTMSASVPAKAPAETESLAADEIIVTARRKDESLQDVPLTVNAVKAEELAKLNIRRFEDISTVVPGLTLATNANGIGGTASVRGVNYDVNASGNNGTIEFYYNDAPISAGNLFQAMFDVGQIELLRGPQGTLRGRASPSGSMTVTTHRASLQDIGGYVTATGTSIGGINANGAIGVPLVKDVLAIRIAGIVDENESNRVKSVNNGTNPYSRTKGGRITARFEPTDTLSFDAGYQKLIQKVRNFDQVESLRATDPSAAASPTFIDGNDRLAVEDTPRRFRQQFDNLNLRGQWAFAGQKLNYVGERNKQKFDVFAPSDTGDVFGPAFPAFLQGYGQQTNSRAKTWAHELRLSSEEQIFGMLDYIVGAFYQKGDFPTTLTTPTPVLFGLPSTTVGGIINLTPVARGGGSKEKSAFGNLTLHLGEATEISGGLRYIDYKANGSLSVAGSVLAAAAENTDENTVIYSGSVKHRFSDDFMVYGNVGSSWRPPVTATGDFSLARSARETSFVNLTPEKSKSYELGFKSSFMEKRLRLNVSAYHQDYKNYPYRSSSGVFFVNTTANTTTTPISLVQSVSSFNFVAAVPVKVDGVEAEASFKIMDRWDIGANGSYARSKIKNGVIPCNDYFPRDGKPDSASTVPTVAQIQTATGGDTISACAVSLRASLAPLWSGTVTSEYSVPLTPGIDGYLRGLLSYYGKSQNDPTNAVDDVKAYALLNLYAGIRSPDGAWEMSLYGKNITKTERVLSRTPTALTATYNIGRTGAIGSSTYRGITYTAPREFGLNLRYAFGSR